MPLSTYAANKILEHVISFQAWTKPTNTYFSLHIADPGPTGGNEASYAGYQRVVASWNSATGSGATNNSDHEFAAVAGSSITVTHIGIWDALSGGNFLFSIDVPDNFFEIGNTPRILDQAVTITPGSAYSTYLLTRITDHLNGVAAFSYDPNVWLGLYNGDPLSSGTELLGGGYSRQNIKINTPSGGASDNIDDEIFATATANLGSATHFAVHTTPTGGQVILAGALTNPVTINDGDEYQFTASDLNFTT